MSDTPTLYEWAGGREAIERMIDRFYDRVEHDDLLSPLFPGGVSTAHREHVTTWWCEVFGGPAGYTERLGGYPAMLDHHRRAAGPGAPLGLGRRPALSALTRAASANVLVRAESVRTEEESL
jgi:truncated hemoglobin YjbI